MSAIGEVRGEEARVFGLHEGFQTFHEEETQEPFGSLEVFWYDAEIDAEDLDEGIEPLGAEGWYWWACFPGCLPDGEASGPFATSTQALIDANEWAPELDDILGD